MTDEGCTLDRFLGGQIIAVQPRRGFRAGHDTVLLAAAVPAKPGETALELGAGAGIASLCVARRVPDSQLRGIEIDSALVAIANQNAARNSLADRVRFDASDVRRFGGDTFNHVFFNPPFHPAEGSISHVAGRELAKRDTGSVIRDWTSAAMRLCQTHGTVTAILRADRVHEMLAAVSGNEAILFPLYARQGEAPKRVIVQAIVGRSGNVRCAQGLVLHSDTGNLEQAEAVLRGGEALSLCA